MTKVQEPVSTRIGPHDPELTRRALDHVRSGTTDLASRVLRVPLDYYRDRDLFAREQDLLRRTPMALIASVQIPKAHDYMVREVLDTSVLVTRDEEGRVHAFLNYCRHRAAQPAHGSGNSRRFTCPYHAWVYDCEGALVGMPGARGFTDVERSEHGLVELPCEERHGLVWVILTAGVPLELDEHLGPFDTELAEWGLSSYEYLTHREFDSEVNWKAALEAFAESYHFPYVHGQSLIGQNTIADVAVYEALGRHSRVCFPVAWIAEGNDDDRSWDPLDNLAIIYWVFPNLVLAFTTVGVELIDILPAGEPGRCRVRHGWMARSPITTDSERAGYDELYELVHAAVRNEDFGVLPLCGAGIRQGQHAHMLIGRNEIGVQHLVRVFADALTLDLSE